MKSGARKVGCDKWSEISGAEESGRRKVGHEIWASKVGRGYWEKCGDKCGARRMGQENWGVKSGARKVGREMWGAKSGAQKVGQGMWGEKSGTRILRKVWRLMLDEKSGGEKTGTRKVEARKVARGY